jgi:molybdenum cofactor biosynthesis enzyme
VAALTVYDLVKAVDKGMTISDIRVVRKTKKAPGSPRGL